MSIKHEGKVINIKRIPSLDATDAAGGAGTPGMELLGQAVIHLGQAAKKNASAFKELASKAQKLSGQFEQLVDSMEFLKSGAAENQLMAAVGRLSGLRAQAANAGIVLLDVADNGGKVMVRYAVEGAERTSGSRHDHSIQIRLALGWKAGMARTQ
jgi:methyl-accepting chemotaxis protein